MLAKIFLLLALLVALARAETLKVLVQPIRSSESSVWGVLTYDADDLTDVHYEPNMNKKQVDGETCVGVEVDGAFKCMSLTDLSGSNNFGDTIVVRLNSDGSVGKLDYSRQPGGENSVKVVKGDLKGPVPVMKEPIKLVDNEVPVEEPPKSFIQKYWMYIVPLLLMVMVSGGPAEGGGR